MRRFWPVILVSIAILLGGCLPEYETVSSSSSAATAESDSSEVKTVVGQYYTGSVSTFRKAGEKKVSLGVWWWDAALIHTPQGEKNAVDTMMEFLTLNNVNEIYLCVDSMVSEDTGKSVTVIEQGKVVTEEEVRLFIKRCTGLGISVEALIGNQGSWILPDDTQFDDYMALLANYQSRADADEAFSGVHIDCEPYLTYSFDKKKNRDLFVSFVVHKAVPAVKDGLDLPLAWSIPSWYNTTVIDPKDGETAPLGEVMFKYCDAISVMSYLDTAQAAYDISAEEIEWAKKYDRKLHLSAECEYYDDGEATSYGEEGKIIMHEEFDKLRMLLDDAALNEYGLSVHYAHTWLNLRELPVDSGSSQEKTES